MKFRIKNTETNRFVSKPTGYSTAKKYADAMNAGARREKYKVISAADTMREIPDINREMSKDEKQAIESLQGVSFALNTPHGSFANTLLAKLDAEDFTITEKQSVYLWWLVYHYRRQIRNPNLIQLAEQNKVY